MTTEALIEAHKAQPLVIVLPELWDKEAIKKDQDGIRKSLVKLDMAIHNNAIQCYLHAEKHGDTSLMRRLLIDIVDAKTGYRRQGIIGHMRMFTPMELVGDIIKLTGTVNGEKRPWKLEEANKTPFWDIKQLNETPALRPVYRDTLIAKVLLSKKEYMAAKENTVDGKPVDPKKPFLDGIHMDKLEEFYTNLENNLIELSKYQDHTGTVRKAQDALKKAEQLNTETAAA